MTRTQKDNAPQPTREETSRRGIEDGYLPLRDNSTVLPVGMEGGEPSLPQPPHLYIEVIRSMEDNARLREQLHHLPRQVTILESQKRVPSSPDIVQPVHPVNTDPNQGGFHRAFVAPLQARARRCPESPSEYDNQFLRTEGVKHGFPVPLPFEGQGNDDPNKANSVHQGGYNVRAEGAPQNGANPAGLREQIMEERIVNLETVLRRIQGVPQQPKGPLGTRSTTHLSVKK